MYGRERNIIKEKVGGKKGSRVIKGLTQHNLDFNGCSTENHSSSFIRNTRCGCDKVSVGNEENEAPEKQQQLKRIEMKSWGELLKKDGIALDNAFNLQLTGKMIMMTLNVFFII